MKDRFEIHRGSMYNREKVRDFRCASCALHIAAREAQRRSKRLRNERRSHEPQPQLQLRLGVIDHRDPCLVTLDCGCRLTPAPSSYSLYSAVHSRLLPRSVSFSFSTLFSLCGLLRLAREVPINTTNFANSYAGSQSRKFMAEIDL